MIAMFIYNTISIVCWIGLAHHSGHWWIALFACLTIITGKFRRE